MLALALFPWSSFDARRNARRDRGSAEDARYSRERRDEELRRDGHVYDRPPAGASTETRCDRRGLRLGMIGVEIAHDREATEALAGVA